jgi:hypothetical protein
MAPLTPAHRDGILHDTLLQLSVCRRRYGSVTLERLLAEMRALYPRVAPIELEPLVRQIFDRYGEM